LCGSQHEPILKISADEHSGSINNEPKEEMLFSLGHGTLLRVGDSVLMKQLACTFITVFLGMTSVILLLGGYVVAQGASTGASPAPTTTTFPTKVTSPATSNLPRGSARATPAMREASEPVGAENIMGRPIQGSDGKPIGIISDVILDTASGQIQRVVIASGQRQTERTHRLGALRANWAPSRARARVRSVGAGPLAAVSLA
jgi:sporulation protein YlmC with PRC-barrel domain